MSWTKAEISKLRELVAANKYFYTEMAPILKKSPAMVSFMARKLNLPPTRETLRHRFGRWNSVHSHLRKDAMTFYLNHTFEETREEFDLTRSQLKSLFTVGYRQAELKHLRKERRDHSPWSTAQLTFLLRHAGLRPRNWIAKKIGRGNQTCIKERLQALGLASRTLQGLTLSQFQQAFGFNPPFYLQTDAGPGPQWYFKIIPWVWLEDELKAGRLRTCKELRLLINARAMFQNWIFSGNALAKMKRIVKRAANE